MRTYNNFRTRRRDFGAFTLIELLVVISIIVVLMALLLPTLAQAKRAAQSVACAANLHGMGQALFEYAGEWNNAIPGGPATSSSFIFSDVGNGVLNYNYNPANCPNVCGSWDFMSPLSNVEGQKFIPPATADDPLAAKPADRLARYYALRKDKRFFCPSNYIMSVPQPAYDNPVPTVGPMLSYTQTANFCFYGGAAPKGDSYGAGVVYSQYVQVPGSYTPRMDLVGQPSEKIFVADGAEASNPKHGPYTELDYIQTAFYSFDADIGAFDQYSLSWNRDNAPGNAGGYYSGLFDARNYAFRHGDGPGDFRFNAAFFDGHVESMDDLTGANPDLWCPPGTIVPASEPTKDVYQKYFGGQSNFVCH